MDTLEEILDDMPVAGLLLVLAVVTVGGLLATALVGWVLMLVLHAFGVQIGYWPCAGIAFLASVVAGWLRS